ncbi:unnamed protein product, partial [marine sediment metagenome]
NLLPEEQKNILLKLLKERVEAKKQGNKELALALKVPINSIYGILGNPTFKNVFNSVAAANCTRIGRELLKRYAKTLDVAGFSPLYGFTDNVYIGIPKGLTETDLEELTTHYINLIKKEAPSNIDSFDLEVNEKIKFMWFIRKQDNQYLYVTTNDEVKIKGGLFDKNTPVSINQLFEKYIKPKIIKELDISFTKEELITKLLESINKNPLLSAEEYTVKNISSYKVETSLHYQISNKYGEGKHLLIPNDAGVGVGRDINYCTLEEFNQSKLSIENIHIAKMMRYIEPFY